MSECVPGSFTWLSAGVPWWHCEGNILEHGAVSIRAEGGGHSLSPVKWLIYDVLVCMALAYIISLLHPAAIAPPWEYTRYQHAPLPHVKGWPHPDTTPPPPPPPPPPLATCNPLTMTVCLSVCWSDSLPVLSVDLRLAGLHHFCLCVSISLILSIVFIFF